MTAPAPWRFDLVLFDLDGTLVETAPEIRDAVDATLQRLGLPPVELRQVEHWIGRGTRELLAEALAFATQTPLAEIRDSELFRRALGDFSVDYALASGTRSRVYPLVRETLEALGRHGVKRAVLTNKEQRFTLSLLRQHGLHGLIDQVVCGDTLATRKPDPAGVAHCLQTFGIPADRALLVGDSSIDVATARNAGVAVWAVTYGYNMGQPIAAARPDRLLADFQPLLDALAPPHQALPPSPSSSILQ
ncbi:HAD-IA family hydrolase [Caenimonas terrae]|uniref:phosphoglycolate phosphatase n=1 Tax=Caenimonas terrae TaxID=696074 RepID=A0ABW0NJP4_9BURK